MSLWKGNKIMEAQDALVMFFTFLILIGLIGLAGELIQCIFKPSPNTFREAPREWPPPVYETTTLTTIRKRITKNKRPKYRPKYLDRRYETRYRL
jgi:hypothetical protein